MYCWGSTERGELGLGGIEEEQVLVPRLLTWGQASEVSEAACGYGHTLFLTTKGHVFSCGSNDFGQLGHDLPRKRPQPVSSLEAYVITQVCCGAEYSMAVNEWGQLFSWGSDTFGQLGLAAGQSMQPKPKIVKSLATKSVIQISCGRNHSMALTNNGDIYCWGDNSYGQLGFGNSSKKKEENTVILKSLTGVPIGSIACGGDHSFAVSRSGAVFAWGKNTSGQLGLNDEQNRHFPCQLKTLRNMRVTRITCGEDFSAFLTLDGGVLTCGNGTNGQLGHGVYTNEVLPKKVVELMGSTVTQMSCGRRHTLALVPSRGRVYSFGLGGSGQLGIRGTQNANTPQVVVGPWVSPSGVALNPTQKKTENVAITRIFAGGDHCFALIRDMKSHVTPLDMRLPTSNPQIFEITLIKIQHFNNAKKDNSIDQESLTYIEIVFRSLACFNASFLLKNNDHFCCTSKHHGVDMANATTVFETIARLKNHRIKELIFECITTDIIPQLVPAPPDVEALRIYLTLPLYHDFCNSKNYIALQEPFGHALLRLDPIPHRIVFQWWTDQGGEYVERVITTYKDIVIYILNKEAEKQKTSEKKIIPHDQRLVIHLNVLSKLNRLNRDNPQVGLPHGLFYIPDLSETFDIQTDYIHWINNKQTGNFNICNYPFIFDAPAKTLLLQTDQAVQMHLAMNQAALQGLFMANAGISFGENQFIVLNVTRDKIVEDTLRELGQYGHMDLKKPLRIKFLGEEAEDAGGVRKEFFMLLLREILDPKYGMFKEYDDTRVIWFSEDSFEDEIMYYLIGLICGLAIYNFTIINLPFPAALYKKLLKEPVTLSDLKDMSPTVGQSLQRILDYKEADLEDVFCLNFEVSREIYGEIKVEPLKPNGSNIPVTLQNKEEFVDLYVDFIFNKSVEKKYKAFQNGFMKVCGGRILELFQAHELMSLVIGNEDYDWDELENNAEYKNGYSSGDKVIRWFWEVFHELPLKEKKNFLLFLTGSDRIPIQGMKAIKIIIQQTTDDRFLPVAHTCFNLLDLPRYKTRERLQYKLLQAIQHTEGFSIV